MDRTRLLDGVDVVAGVALLSAVPVVFFELPAAVLFSVLAILLAPPVLVATGLRRSPRDALQCWLAAGVYLPILVLVVGLQQEGVLEYVAIGSLPLVPVLATAIVVRAGFRLRREPLERQQAPVRTQRAGGKARASGILPAGADRSTVVSERRVPDRSGPIVYPSRPRARAIVLRLTLLPFLFVPFGALVLLLAILIPGIASRPLLTDSGIQALVFLTLVPALLHVGTLAVLYALERRRDDWTDGPTGSTGVHTDSTDVHTDAIDVNDARPDVRTDERRWAGAHVATWVGFLGTLGLEPTFATGTGTPLAARIGFTAVAGVATVAVLVMALGLTVAGVRAVRADESGDRE